MFRCWVFTGRTGIQSRRRSAFNNYEQTKSERRDRIICKVYQISTCKLPNSETLFQPLRPSTIILRPSSVVDAPVDAVHAPSINCVQDTSGRSGVGGFVAVEVVEAIGSRSGPSIASLASGVGKDVGREGDTSTEGSFLQLAAISLIADIMKCLTLDGLSLPVDVATMGDVGVVVRSSLVGSSVTFTVVGHTTGVLVASLGVYQVDILKSGSGLGTEEEGGDGSELHFD